MPAAGPITYVALLRGINVGGNNMISMSALRDSFTALGFKDVASYINSGNILFRSKEVDARKLEVKIERMLAADYTIPCKVVIRSAAEMAQLVKSLPKDWDGNKDWRYTVVFLRHTIDTKSIVDGLNATPDLEKVRYVPGTLLWSARVQDLTKTAMLKMSTQKIFQDMTVRNLNTTKKLHELMQKMSLTPARS